MRLSYEEDVKGRTVIDATGNGIGELVGIYLEPGGDGTGLRIAAIAVKLRAEVADSLGVRHGTFHAATVAIPAGAVQALGDAVLLNVDVRTLVQPPAAEPHPDPAA